MGRVIAIANQKGGVGKTTIAGNIAYEASKKGLKTILIDSDPQGSISTWLLNDDIKKNKDFKELTDLLIDEELPENYFKEIRKNLWIIPTNFKNNRLREFAETKLIDKPFIFSDTNDYLKKDYDLIIYDLSPSSSQLEKRILVSVDEIIIATKTEYFSVEGLEKIIKFINEILKNHKSNAKIKKLVINEIDRTIKMHKNYTEYLKGQYSQVIEIFEIYKNSNFKYSQDKNLFYSEIKIEDENIIELNKIINSIIR